MENYLRKLEEDLRPIAKVERVKCAWVMGKEMCFVLLENNMLIRLEDIGEWWRFSARPYVLFLFKIGEERRFFVNYYTPARLPSEIAMFVADLVGDAEKGALGSEISFILRWQPSLIPSTLESLERMVPAWVVLPEISYRPMFSEILLAFFISRS